MTKHDENLDRLSEQVADEDVIRWSDEISDDPKMAETLQPLRDLAAISKA